MSWMPTGTTRIPANSICRIRGHDWNEMTAMFVPFRGKKNKGRWVTLSGNIISRCDATEFKVIKHYKGLQ